MKFTDLMVGDLVSITTYPGTRYEETDIETVTMVNECGAITLFDGSGDGLYNESMEEVRIEPIPLTPEIMKKNGFEEIDLTKIGGEFYDAFYILRGKRAGIEHAIFQLSRMRGNSKRWQVATGSRDVVIVINYVHELQHALKLCGIDKQITL